MHRAAPCSRCEPELPRPAASPVAQRRPADALAAGPSGAPRCVEPTRSPRGASGFPLRSRFPARISAETSNKLIYHRARSCRNQLLCRASSGGTVTPAEYGGASLFATAFGKREGESQQVGDRHRLTDAWQFFTLL